MFTDSDNGLINSVTIAIIKDDETSIGIVNDVEKVTDIIGGDNNIINIGGIEYTISNIISATICLNDGLYTSFKANATYQQ